MGMPAPAGELVPRGSALQTSPLSRGSRSGLLTRAAAVGASCHPEPLELRSGAAPAGGISAEQARMASVELPLDVAQPAEGSSAPMLGHQLSTGLLSPVPLEQADTAFLLIGAQLQAPVRINCVCDDIRAGEL